MFFRAVERFGKNINPHLQRAASKDECGRTTVAASPSLNSILFKPAYRALSLPIASISGEMSVAKR
jgi:hypothetical protein